MSPRNPPPIPAALAPLALLGLLLATSACNASPPTVTPPPPTADPSLPPTVDPNAEALVVQQRNAELALGLERFAFRLNDAAGNPVQASDVTVRFYQGEPAAAAANPSAEGPAVYFGQGLPDGGAWVVYTEFDSSGPWTMAVEAKDSLRPEWKGSARVGIDVTGRTDTPRVGLVPPMGETPVLAPGADPATVTSDPEPDPALYAQTVEAARTSGKPTVVVFSSPEHCPNPMCNAVLDEVKAVKAMKGDRVNVIHIETHDLANPDNPSPTARAWGVVSEPWVFVLDKRGLVSARIEGGLDRTELDLLLERALGGL